MKQELGKPAKDFDEIIECMREAVKKKVRDAYKKGFDEGSLDVEQRVEGAYQRGLEDGKKATWGQVADASSAEYQRGLDDAWDAARKVSFNSNDGGLNIEELDEIFGCYILQQIFRRYSAQQTIAKLKAYEEKQKADEEIKIGDEVNWDGDNYIVTYINIDIDTSEVKDYDLMMWDGSVVDHVKKCSFVKTDRHFDIDKILEAMKE